MQPHSTGLQGGNKDDNKDIKITAPEAGNGYRADINEVLGDLKVRYKRTSKEDWVATRESGDTIRLVGVGLKKGLVPDVRGMSLRDAIYLLENSGLKVRYNGKGRVLSNHLSMAQGYMKAVVFHLI